MIFLEKKVLVKKLLLKKVKYFLEKNVDKKDAIALSSIQKSKIFYDEKENSNKIIIDGSIFNTKYNLNFLRNITNQKFN